MKKLLFVLAIIGSSVVGYSQHHGHHGHHLHHSLHPKMHLQQKNYLNHLRFTGGLGTGTYFGDLCSSSNCFVFRPQLNAGLYLRFHNRFSARAEFLYSRLAADDANGKNVVRNLSFASNNIEISANLAFDFFKYDPLFFKRKDFTPYVSAGLGMLWFNPMAKDRSGSWNKLRPLKTEGVAYANTTVVIPLAIGVRMKMSDHLDVCGEFGYRITFTDYLDDVSTNYLDDSKITNRKTAELANRTTEGGFDINPSIRQQSNGQYILNQEKTSYIVKEGSKRGNPSRNDGYMIFSVRAEYTIKVLGQSGNNINRVYSPKFKTRKR